MFESHSPKRAQVVEALRATGGVVVALSGGVDSAVLLALAVEALGPDRVLAATGASASLAGSDLEDARRLCEGLGVRHVAAATLEIELPAYRANAGDRCYHCRTELFDVLGRLAGAEGISSIAYGAIVDDLDDERPGMRAAAERGVLAPLLDARIDKEDVRGLAAELGLHVRDKPASPCLSSRIPVGTPVTVEKLAQIERAEGALKALGLRRVRVRHHGEVARIEVDPAGRDRLAAPAVRAAAAAGVRSAGFRWVTLDLEETHVESAAPAASERLYSIGPSRPGGQ